MRLLLRLAVAEAAAAEAEAGAAEAVAAAARAVTAEPSRDSKNSAGGDGDGVTRSRQLVRQAEALNDELKASLQVRGVLLFFAACHRHWCWTAS